MPRTKITDMILGPSRTFTVEQLMELVEARRGNLVKLLEVYQFADMMRFEDIMIVGSRRIHQHYTQGVSHAISEDRLGLRTSFGGPTLPIDTYGLFDYAYNESAKQDSVEYSGWGITKKGDWFISFYKTRKVSKVGYKSYTRATIACLQPVGLEMLVHRLVRFNIHPTPESVLLHQWYLMGNWVTNTLHSLQERIRNLEEAKRKMEIETLLLDMMQQICK